MNAIRGLAAVIGALAAFQAIVLIWGFAAGLALPTPIWMRLALAAVSTLGTLAGGAVRSAVASLPPRPLDE